MSHVEARPFEVAGDDYQGVDAELLKALARPT
jgi:hypothetical protein